jgi:hypothetical protein
MPKKDEEWVDQKDQCIQLIDLMNERRMDLGISIEDFALSAKMRQKTIQDIFDKKFTPP